MRLISAPAGAAALTSSTSFSENCPLDPSHRPRYLQFTSSPRSQDGSVPLTRAHVSSILVLLKLPPPMAGNKCIITVQGGDLYLALAQINMRRTGLAEGQGHFKGALNDAGTFEVDEES